MPRCTNLEHQITVSKLVLSRTIAQKVFVLDPLFRRFFTGTGTPTAVNFGIFGPGLKPSDLNSRRSTMKTLSVLLFVSLLRGSLGEGYVRAKGLYDNQFTGLRAPDESAIQTAPASIPTPPVSFQFVSITPRSGPIRIFPNGYVGMENSVVQVQPSDIPATTANPLVQNIVMAPFMVPISAVNNEFSYRVLSCFDLDQQEYARYECARAKSDLLEMKVMNPAAAVPSVDYVIIVTWRIISLGTEFYTQAVFSYFREEDNVPSNYVYFLYDGDLPDTTNLAIANTYPLIGIYDGARSRGFGVCVDNTPISQTGQNFDILKLNSNTACGKPGQLIMPSVNVGVTGLPAFSCLNLDIPKDTCLETVRCEEFTVNPDTGLQVPLTYRLTFTYNFPSGFQYVPVWEDGSNNLLPQCVHTLSDTNLANNYILDIDIVNPTTGQTPCGYFVDTATSTISGSFRLLKESMRAQHGDFRGNFSCSFAGLSGQISTSFNIGPISTREITRTGRSLNLALVDAYGVAGEDVVSSCEIGEQLYLTLSYNTGTPFEGVVDPLGAYGATCQFSPDPLFQTNVVTVINEGCSSRDPTQAFYVHPTPNQVNNRGWARVAGVLGPNQNLIMATGFFKCARFENLPQVYIRCDARFCFANSNANRCVTSCFDSDEIASTGRKRRSPQEHEYVYANLTVLDARPAVTEPACVDTTTAIGTLVGLVLGLVLATGLSLGTFLKIYTRSSSSKA